MRIFLRVNHDTSINVLHVIWPTNVLQINTWCVWSDGRMTTTHLLLSARNITNHVTAWCVHYTRFSDLSDFNDEIESSCSFPAVLIEFFMNIQEGGQKQWRRDVVYGSCLPQWRWSFERALGNRVLLHQNERHRKRCVCVSKLSINNQSVNI